MKAVRNISLAAMGYAGVALVLSGAGVELTGKLLAGMWVLAMLGQLIVMLSQKP